MNGQMNMYDLNKSIVSQLPFFSEDNWSGAEKVVKDWLDTKTDKFYMLYGREINYFTLFYNNIENAEFKSLFDAMKVCLDSVGPIYAIDATEDGAAIEIWANVDNQATCLYLFPYDEGVLYYE